jgi:hypothetical protein
MSLVMFNRIPVINFAEIEDEEAAETALLLEAIREARADPRADPRNAPHEEMRAWPLRIAAGEFDAERPEPRMP